MIRLGAGAVLILLAISAKVTQQPSPPKVETFSATANLVLVDFVVTDKSDRVVGGLAAKDFVVKEDGKERPIVSFVAFDGDALQVAEAVPSASPESPGYAPSIPPVAPTVTVILVDDGHLTHEMAMRLKPSLKALLSSVAGRRGGLALLAPWSGVSVAGRLPEDGPTLASAVDRIHGQRMPSAKEEKT